MSLVDIISVGAMSLFDMVSVGTKNEKEKQTKKKQKILYSGVKGAIGLSGEQNSLFTK